MAVVMVLVGLTMISSSVLAQEAREAPPSRSYNFSIAGIYYISSDSDYNDVFEATYGASLGFIYWFQPSIGIGLEYQYMTARGSLPYSPLIGSMEDVNLTLKNIVATGYYRFNPAAETRPYLGFGIGSYAMEYGGSRIGGLGSTWWSDTFTGYHVAAGVEYKWFYAEARYLFISANDANIGSLDGLQIFLGGRF
jgi:opacity protein-like surface antigen